MNLMELFVKIGVDDKASKQIASITQKLGNGVKTASKIGATAVKGVAVATGIAATAIAGLATSAIKSYSEFEQLEGGVKKLFGEESMKTVLDNADKAYKTAGMSANQYLETTTSFAASLIAGLDGDTAKAAEYADMAIRDMADNANTFGTDISMIQNAYQGFAKQNYTMLDNLKLGYGGTASEMARLINDSGVLGDTVTVTASNINRVSFDQIVEAINVTQERMGILGTTATEAEKTISGSLSMVKSSWSNLMTSLASGTGDTDDKVQELVTSVSTLWDNVQEPLSQVLSGVADLIKKVAPQIAEALPGVVNEILPTLLEAALETVNALALAVPDLLKTVLDTISENKDMIINTVFDVIGIVGKTVLDSLDDLLVIGLDLLTGIMQGLTENLPAAVPYIINTVLGLALMLSDPETLVPLLNSALDMILALADGLIAAIPQLVEARPQIVLNIAKTLIEFAPEIFKAGGHLLKSLYDAFVPEDIQAFFASIWENIKSAFGKVGEWFSTTFGDAWQSVKDVFTKGGDVFEGITSSIEDFFKTTINHIIDGFNNVMAKPFEGINKTIEAIKAIDLGIFGKPFSGLSTVTVPQIPKLFRGGVLEKGQLGLLEGSGAEAVVPLENNKKWISAVARDMRSAIYSASPFGGVATVNNYITINGSKYDSEESLADIVALKIQQMINGRSAAYA